jgi:hypothetical protein
MCAWPAALKWVKEDVAALVTGFFDVFMKYAVTTGFSRAAIIAI